MQGYPPRAFDEGDTDSTYPSPGKEEKKSERRGVINRVNRACNNCRRMKMRCVGAEDPPCKRCRNGGLECIMEKPGRSGNENVGEDRIRSLETQVAGIQNTLSDLVQTLRAGMSSGASNGSGHTPDYGQGYAPMSAIQGASPRTLHQLPGLASQPRHSPQAVGVTPPNNLQALLGRGSQGTINPYVSAGSPYPQPIHRQERKPWQAFSTPGADSEASRRHMSLPPSRAGSEDRDDMLGPDDIVAPLGAMSNMAGLVEAAVERAREEKARGDPGSSSAGKRDADEERGGVQKKSRVSFSSDGPAVVEAQGLPQTLAAAKPKSRVKKTHVHAYPDAVELGIVTEEEGRELMSIYYSGSSNFIPCYDPSFDTWDSLKIRSPFSITTIVMVGARVRDGGGPVSDVQRLCREHVQKIAQGTMFNPVARVEAVQAMSILAAFSDNGWLPGGHAVRMALDIGINKSFIKLLRSGMGKGKTPEELEEERPLVVHSRVWFCLYLMEHQMAYGMGRPAILREDESIHQCRRLLEHPLSITSDARLVSTVELTALRAPLHIELTASPDLPIEPSTLTRLKQANHEFDSWERYWDRVLSDRFGKARGDFYRESLVIQRQYAELFVNSQLLRGIREPSDVVSMPEEKRALAIRAMRNAQTVLEVCLKGQNYRNGLRYAVHYTHVCAAFAASFLIRIARLFPQELNLKKTAKDVEELAGILAEIPAGRYARSLRLILRRARRAKVIPAASQRTSPTRIPAPLPLTNSTGAAAAGATPAGESPFSPTALVNTPFLAVSPSNNLLLNATTQLLDESPQSAQELSEFDLLFARENLERSGLQIGEGEHLPLFLDGHSLGGIQAAGDPTAFLGLEQFFLPADVDTRLAGGQVPQETGDLWW
ncbi:hypothetical protein CC85DRAFT_272355 [Cutaneotrichosporon oleaginosum]|uniref:Zn(2)-C6 fungal-type domain-containing protein n=1 Tax=Cutaneotrichosporon oleaginosum TaxID=879819 RepID=A0A0J0XR66_9TREE|nr:uncharacterized protein CC85DRAFT_272355 [Cutaneotrichosporon oleaginosum]KLT43621.1 hypothetical protein CC85DRAFT_272355 [Cutaneotrichosporon oleaginosum]